MFKGLFAVRVHGASAFSSAKTRLHANAQRPVKTIDYTLVEQRTDGLYGFHAAFNAGQRAVKTYCQICHITKGRFLCGSCQQILMSPISLHF